ncbi:MAG: type II CAAX prenyl endopeptidase Rce1 family protein [Sellimonas sp.]|uniref:CPBP family glutamic-type intramembrane protease n=1 Tax=Sellimonas sp. TaxID=2021466 RepID=UPI0039A36011
MNRQTKPLKPWHGVIVLGLSAVCVFLIGPALGEHMGLYGTLVSELLLLLVAVGCTWIFQGDFRSVFPIRKPTFYGMFGTFLLWMGVLILTLALTMLITYFFPAEMLGTSMGLSYTFMGVPALVAVVIVAVMPAFCEEAVFRGVVFNSFWPLGRGNKWIPIILTGCIFGAFHGSIWRFFPTAILGIAMAYILAETGNMVYAMFFHAINNLLPLLMTFALQFVWRIIYFASNSSYDAAIYGASANYGISFASVGVYIAGSGIGLFFIYIGNFLLHRGRPGYEGKIFSGKRKRHLYILIIASAVLFFLGIASIVGSAAAQGLGYMMRYHH